MTDTAEAHSTIAPARGDVPAERACLRCKATFGSEGFGERICGRCKSSSTWRSAASASNRPERRRSSGRMWQV